MHRLRFVLLYGFCLALFTWSACGPTQKPKGEACEKNDECATGLKCLGGKCNDGQKGSSCSDDKDCSSGLVCNNQACTQGSTEPTPDGGSDGGSVDTAPDAAPDTAPPPREKPVTPDTTPDEKKPDLAPDTPAPPEPSPEPTKETTPDTPLNASCRNNTQCRNGQLCLITKDRLTATCRPKPTSCQRDSDCAATPGTYCRLVGLPGGNSVETLCVYPFDNGKTLKKVGEVCADGTDCQSGVCLSSLVCGAYCKEDKDCQSQSQFYCGTYTYFQRGEFGGCYPKCNTEADCPDGYQCDSNGKCIPKDAKKVGSACRSKADCPATGGECLNNWNNGYCLTSCTPTKTVCTTDASLCTNNNQDCRDDVDDPSRKICVPRCGTGSVCGLFGGGQGYCLKACTEDKDCRKDYYCAAVNDNATTACLPRGTNKLGEACEANGDCESGRCRLFPSGRYCTQRCDSTACPAGYSCNTYDTIKLCEKGCVKNSNCPKGYQCIAQQCVIPQNTTGRAVGEACTADAQCAGGKCMNNAGLFPNGYCTQTCGGQTTCPSGTICLNYGGTTGSLCTKSCQADAACGRSDLFCFFVQLSGNNGGAIPCSNAAPCPSGSPFPVVCNASLIGSFCSTGVCLGRGPRPSGRTCTSGFQCQSGYCYVQTAIPGNIACTPGASPNNCPTATPVCHPTNKVCVQCASAADCGAGLSCVNARCTTGGYCADKCSGGASCPQNTKTKCLAVFNRNANKIGDYCLPECRSSLECQGDFLCKQDQGSKTCVLP